jgi:subtilisin
MNVAYMSNGASVPGLRFDIPSELSPDWAFGNAEGEGVRVCIVDSGVNAIAQLGTNPVAAYAAHGVDRGVDGQDLFTIERDDLGDVAGHGTAVAGIIHQIAPRAEITSVRILGPGLGGAGGALLAALQWAIEQGFHVVNLSLSTRREKYKQALHDLADAAHFADVALVSSAHNSPVASFPWRFASVFSVGSHAWADARFEVSPQPPVEFFGRGLEVPVNWSDGLSRTVTGNSFATPHISGYLALIRAAHPDLRTNECRFVLSAVARNVLTGGKK